MRWEVTHFVCGLASDLAVCQAARAGEGGGAGLRLAQGFTSTRHGHRNTSSSKRYALASYAAES